MICKRSIHTHLFGVAAAFVLSSLAFAAQNPVPFVVQPLSPAAIAPGVPAAARLRRWRRWLWSRRCRA